LKIPKQYEKIKIKCLWLRLFGPSEIHMPLLGSPDPRSMYGSLERILVN
jgi:hypothetical protein